jgi:hypothetical protein
VDQLELLAADRANAELHDRRAHVEHAPRDTGVTVRAALVLVAQVAVRVDLHHHEIAVDGVDRAGDAGGDGVLTAQPDQQLTRAQVLLGAGRDCFDHAGRPADYWG